MNFADMVIYACVSIGMITGAMVATKMAVSEVLFLRLLAALLGVVAGGAIGFIMSMVTLHLTFLLIPLFIVVAVVWHSEQRRKMVVAVEAAEDKAFDRGFSRRY